MQPRRLSALDGAAAALTAAPHACCGRAAVMVYSWSHNPLNTAAAAPALRETLRFYYLHPERHPIPCTNMSTPRSMYKVVYCG